ncbi:transglycosylase SLT domain-containing protein [Hamadaea tsunoensis]|uniref:transglycosylase SLT domain-containing protein n=1 Tax=Hamadaea tsunoensis TaxID=53368 RepID=UPI00041A83A0|nr:transglycosylase SLT domain-containing protein [Hamadaea tsunoensis]
MNSRNGLVISIAALVAGASLVGLAAFGFSGKPDPVAVVGPSPSASAVPPSIEAAVLPSASTAKSPSVKPSASRKPSPKPTPSRKPVTVTQPPPKPKASPLPSGVKCPYHAGTDAAKTDVRAALDTAAAKSFWPGTAVDLTPQLLKAIAWQESGWQSTIMACDGGIGTMQVMPNTATWMNQKFGTDYDVKTLSGNTMIGAAYLQWLVKYFGDVYFDSDYSLSADDCVSGDPAVPNYKTPCLLNAVIASYNYGYGAVDTDAGIKIPNPSYVSSVRALMVNCTCFGI